MTVSQLVHPVRGLLHHGHPVPLSVRRRRRPEALVWRAIATGLSFGLIALTMMALAVGAGRV